MNKEEAWDELFKFVQLSEDRCYDFASKALDKNNMYANQIHSAEATAFQRIRYLMESLVKNN